VRDVQLVDFSPAPEMTMEELTLLNELISSYCGLYFPPHKKEILAARVWPLVRRLNLQLYRDYYLHLQFGTNGTRTELANLVAALTNNETYFFRETEQLESLFADGLSNVVSRLDRSQSIRLLCAGCSSGEEAYTLSIFAKENQHRHLGHDLVIDAFDIDNERIRVAKQAEYSERSLRVTSPEQRHRFFLPLDDGRYRLRPLYRQGVYFSYGNLLDTSRFAVPAIYDVVICRNVLIYFSEEALLKAIKHFAYCLKKDGLLFLGHSESVIGRTTLFESLKIGRSIAYRKV